MEETGVRHRARILTAAARGFSITEVKISNLPRRHGKTKYGRERFVRGLLDLLTVLFITRFSKRPLHLIGLGGIIGVTLGFGILFFFLVITVFLDIMRNRTLSGWGKALWAIGIIILPFLGIFLYLIVNGDKMHQRATDDAKAADDAAKAYVREAAGTSSPEAELDKLATLHEQGALSDDEYDQAKSKVVGA